jgi:HSP20 family protein
MFGAVPSLHSSLFDDVWRLQQQVDQMLGDALSLAGGIRSLPRGSFPALNVVQTPEDIQVYLFAPGLDPKKLQVSLEQRVLTISGERHNPTHEEATYYRQERFGGEFRRVITLPSDVDAEQVQATYRDGIVHITLHRQEAAKPRRIEIH